MNDQPNRCGGCNLCCTVMKVAMEPPKPAFTPCPQMCKGGCAIYATRPEPCVVWSCLWLHSHDSDRADVRPMPSAMRPDRAGVVLNTNSAGYVLAHCTSEGAWQREPMRRWLLAKAARTRVLIHLAGDRTLLLNPDGRTEELRFTGVDPGTNERLYKRVAA